MSGTAALVKGIPEQSLVFPLCKDKAGSWLSVTLWCALTGSELCWQLDLRSPASGTVRNKCMLFIGHLVYGALS